ncbi:type VII secretion target [Micromonospora sp. NPDC003197]
MTKGFEVDQGALLRHAGSVDTVAQEVQIARSAAAHVQMGRDAYGRLPICQALAGFLEPIQGQALNTLVAAVDALNSTADALRSAAGHYGDTDTEVARAFSHGSRP